MPRLRYLKKFEQFNEDEYDNEERSSGQSWLSNTAIVSSLSDEKIRTAIKTLKAQISCLEAELLLRSHNDGRKNTRHPNEITELYNKRTRKSRSRSGDIKAGRKIRGKSITNTLCNLGLSKKQTESLLQEWGKILAGGKG